ncbi:MAG: LptF/LptG family permease [Muribaculaceae bacterium]|nr:LptF/LptG family permease [Muribaculaceae bacterium]
MKILDKYIIRKFLGTYVFSLGLILAITIMFDINEKLDAFQKAPLRETIFDYFLNFLPYFANQFSPLFVFISVIFFTSKLAGNSEIIAILSSGVSFNRLLRPYLSSATVIAAATRLLSAYIIPPANAKRIAFTNTYVKDKRVSVISNVQMRIGPGEVVYFGDFSSTNERGSRFSLDKFDGNRLASRLTAATAIYRGGYSWRLRNYARRTFTPNRELLQTGMVLDTVIPIAPNDIIISRQDQEKMTSPDLAAYIDRQRQRGVANIKQFEIEYHRRYASTAAAFILTVIGMCLSCRKVKGGMGLNIGIGLALSFTYILFMGVTQTFAINGLTSPAVAMWIPNIVYTFIALALYIRANRY